MANAYSMMCTHNSDLYIETEGMKIINDLDKYSRCKGVVRGDWDVSHEIY